MNKKTKTTTLLTLALLVTMVFSAILNGSIPIANAQDDYGNVLQYEWRQSGADASKTYASDGPAPGTPNIMWERTFASRPGNPTAFNGMVFVPQGGNLYALDPFTGDTIYTIFGGGGGGGGPPGMFGGIGTPTKVDDTRMLISGDLYETATGNKIWDGPPGFSGIYVPEEKKVFSNRFGGGPCWDVSDLSQPPVLLWDRTDDPELEMEYMDTYGQGLIFTARWSYIHAINITTGETVWETATTGYKSYSMAYADGKLFSGQLDSKFVCWDAATGEKLWEYDAGAGWAFWAGEIVVLDGKVYSMNQDQHCYAFDAETGELVWRYKGPGVYYQGNAIGGGGKIFTQTGDSEYRDPDTREYGEDEFVCLDAETGEVLWSLPTGLGAPSTYHILAYGNLYFTPTKIVETMVAGVFSRATIGNTLVCIGDEPADWSMWRGDPAHSAHGSGPETLSLRWKYKTNAAITATPSIADGIAYVGSHDKNIYALDADTGSQIWNFTTSYRVYSSVAVVNNRVYTGTDDGNVYCLDAKTGNQIWINAEPGDILQQNWGALQTFNIRSSPAVIDGKVYVGSLDQNLYCINANSGSTVWKFESPGTIQSSPAVANGAVYVAVSAGRPAARLYKLNVTDGSIIWWKMLFYQRGPGPLVPWSSPTVADGFVFQAVDGFETHCLNDTDGSILWTYRAVNWQVIGASPLYANGKVYITDFFTLVALDPTRNTGKIDATTANITWTQFLAREIYGSPAYSLGKVYANSEQMALYVLDAETGEKLSFTELGTQSISSPALYNTRLYIGGFDNYVYCYEEAPNPPPIPAAQIELSLSENNVVKGSQLYIEGRVVNVQAAIPLTVSVDNPDSTYEDITLL
ncbi:MAG: PQQ-binding-like beta-propeller repeat protein, partial [Candidatus Bathyarchaeota archaeon]|nr:PQQ-binding-like beta-propeller repeat protein [Candidatus Bathyarchaeota archaeon]